MKKLVLIILFFLITPLTLAVSFFTLAENHQKKQSPVLAKNNVKEAVPSQVPSHLYAALPQETGAVLGTVDTADARPIIITKYLEKHQSPLLPYADELLAAAETYDVDYRLIVAIAQCESNLCKKSPPDSYNCWGFENGATKFLSWEQALDQVAKTLRERYLDQGLETPEEIMVKYAPPSVEKGGPWAKCVNQFIEELEYGI
jgi:hypothetical protein